MTFPRDLLRRLWGDLPIYIYAGLCAAVVFSLWGLYGRSYDPAQTGTSFDIFQLCAVVMAFGDCVWALLRHRPAQPAAFLRERYLSPAFLVRLLAAIPAMALCIVLIPMFSGLKSMIPLLADYRWDAPIIALERTLMLGHDSWEVLQPVLGHPPVTAFLALLYHLWTALLYPGVILLLLHGAVPGDTRRKFFLSYAMAWSLIGGLLAALLASYGPAFVQPLAGIGDFAGQMAYLKGASAQIPVMTVPVQEALLTRFSAGDSSIGSGISAMPSMHVAIAALYWLAMREVSPRAARRALAFMVLIWLGSVHLAYHYALDGAVSVVSVWVLWKVSGAAFRAWDRLPLPALQPTLRTNTVPAE